MSLNPFSDARTCAVVPYRSAMVAEALARALDRAGLTVAGTALTANAALPLAHALRPDVVVIDHHVLDRGAPHLIGTIRTLDPEVQVVVVGGGPTRDEM